jgi:hypothetical protein
VLSVQALLVTSLLFALPINARLMHRRVSRLARAISDAGLAEFARLLGYKQTWRGGTLVVADRWYPSSKLCPACGCGHSADRDCNAAVNLARWGQTHHEHHLDPRTPKHGGPATNAADGTALTSTPRVPVKPARMKREQTFTPHQRPEPTMPEKGGAEHSTELFDTL